MAVSDKYWILGLPTDGVDQNSGADEKYWITGLPLDTVLGAQVDETITLAVTVTAAAAPHVAAHASIAIDVDVDVADRADDADGITLPVTLAVAAAPVATAHPSITLPTTLGFTPVDHARKTGAISLAVTLGIAARANQIQPESITLAASLGIAVVASASRQITVGAGEAAGQAAAPTVSGGDPTMQLYIGGINLTAYHLEDQASIESQTIGRWTASVRLFDSTGTIAALFDANNGGVGLSITIQEYGYKLFAGCVQTVRCQRYLSTTAALEFEITANDGSSILDRRVVKQALFLATEDAAEVIRHVIANECQGEGFSYAEVPATLGVLGSDLPVNFQSAKAVIDQVTTLVGCVWWVDVNKGIHVSALDELPAAPFGLTETSENWRGVDDRKGMDVTRTLDNFATEVIVVSNRNVLPGGGSGLQTTETYILGPNGQEAAFNAGLSFGYLLLLLPISRIISLTVNGDNKRVYDMSLPSSPPYGSDPLDWYYYRISQIVFPSFAPSVGDTIIVVYVPQSSNAAITEGSALAPITPGLGNCGSGRYQVVVQVQDIELRADLDAIAVAYLAKLGGVPTQIVYRTNYHGLQPGQLQSVNIPLIGLSSRNLLITSVSGHSVGSTMGHNCSFWWTVTARSNLDPGNWVQWFQRLVRRTEQPKPLLIIEATTFILGSGSSLSGAFPGTNPAPIKKPGLLFRMTIAASDPPVDQDLVVTFRVNGLPVGSITLPAGSTPDIFLVQLFDTSDPQYVYTDDSVKPYYTYVNIGASPVAARNVTVTMEHTV